MKHNLIFFTYVLTTIFLSHCMENMQQANILQKITVIQAPTHAKYLTKDRAIIMGKNGCSIINLITNQEIINIDNEYHQYYSHLDLSPDKKEVALSTDGTIKIYNTETGKQMWMKKESYDRNRITFSPREKILFSVVNQINQNWSTIKKHNYITDKTTIRYIDYAIYPNITLHPTENILCAGNNKEISLYTVDDLQLRLSRNNPKSFKAYNYQYSHNGAFIVATGFDEIRIMNELLIHLFSFSTNDDYKTFDATQLNSDSTILAVLVRNRHPNKFFSIEYYDLLTKKCIYSAQIKDENKVDNFKDLSFSPENTKLMITLNQECFITLTPFGIKQGAFIHWILKNYQTNNYGIPGDVIQYIVNSYIEAF